MEENKIPPMSKESVEYAMKHNTQEEADRRAKMTEAERDQEDKLDEAYWALQHPKELSHCQGMAEKTVRVYIIANTLNRVWKGLPAERKEETLDGLTGRIAELRKNNQIRPEDYHNISDGIHALKELNKDTGGEKVTYESVRQNQQLGADQAALFEKAALDMVIHSIADCECGNK